MSGNLDTGTRLDGQQQELLRGDQARPVVRSYHKQNLIACMIVAVRVLQAGCEASSQLVASTCEMYCRTCAHQPHNSQRRQIGQVCFARHGLALLQPFLLKSVPAAAASSCTAWAFLRCMHEQSRLSGAGSQAHLQMPSHQGWSGRLQSLVPCCGPCMRVLSSQSYLRLHSPRV